MIWGIIGALSEETALIEEKMVIESQTVHYDSTFTSGYICERQIVVVHGCAGKINLAICTHILICEFHADIIINVGIAGSMSEDLRLLDVVLSDHAIFYDFDQEYLKSFYPFIREYRADTNLIELCSNVIENMPDRLFNYKVGRIASGDYFVNSKKLRDKIIKNCQPLCIDMGGAAIAQVAIMNYKPFIIIRSISDDANEGANEIYENFVKIAAENSALIALRAIETCQKLL